MQKNNLCPLSNKILLYEEIDSFSQSTFNPNKLFFGSTKKSIKHIKQKYINNIANRINPVHKINNDINNKNAYKKNNINNTNNNNNKLKRIKNNFINRIKNFKKNYIKTFQLNYYIFSISYILNKNKIYDKNNNNNGLIKQFYSYNDSIKIIPKKEYYYKHHMIFLERPNFNNIFFNKIKKNLGLEKLYIYQNHKKKENKIEQINIINENDNQKIFDTNVLETIENYSTTITQSLNNEKQPPLTPFEIFRRCEDTNKKIKDLKKKDGEQKLITTFSESEISFISKNFVDESFTAIVKDIFEKPNKYKQFKNEKKYTNYFLKKKDIQKFTKNNKNPNNNVNNANYAHQNSNKINNNNNKNQNNNNKINNNNDDKELIDKKRISTSTNKKTKKRVIDNIYKNTVSKSSSKKTSFINNATSNKWEETTKANCTSFGKVRKNKGVLNLKKESYKIKSHATKFSDNYLMNDNTSINNSKLVSTSYNNIDKLLTFFLTSKNNNQRNNKSKSKYEEFSYNNAKRRQVKKNTALTIVNNNNNIMNSESSQEKYNNTKKDTTFKSKSPLTRLFLKKNEYEANSRKKNIYKKKKSVLIPEMEHNSQLAQSINKYFFEKNKDDKKNISSNNVTNCINNNNNNNNTKKHFNIMSLSRASETNRQNSYQFMKLNKRVTKSNLLK